MSRFDSTAPIRQFLTTGAFAMLVDALMAVGALAMLMAYSWDLTLVVCAFLAVFAALNLGTYPALRNLTHESIAADASENSSFIETIERHRAVKLLGAESQREDGVRAMSKRSTRGRVWRGSASMSASPARSSAAWKAWRCCCSAPPR